MSGIDTYNIILGVILNVFLLYLITRFGKSSLGNYRSLLKIFACNDILMLALHALVQPASVTSGPAIGVFSQRYPEYKHIIAFSCSFFTVPFTLMNINFLHRFWSVQSPHKVGRFSHPCSIMQIALYPIFMAGLWYIGSLATMDNLSGMLILQQSLSVRTDITVEEGWLVLHFWDHDQISILGVAILLLAAAIIFTNIIVAGVLCLLTLKHLKSANIFSATLKAFQFKILRALFAQPARRLDRWFTVLTFFPVVDAIVIMVVMKDYREGLLSMIAGRYRIEGMNSNWMTTQAN